MSAKPKVNRYEQRKLNGIPAPLEKDSDSDFNNGAAYVYEKPKRKTRKSRGRDPPAGNTSSDGGEAYISLKSLPVNPLGASFGHLADPVPSTPRRGRKPARPKLSDANSAPPSPAKTDAAQSSQGTAPHMSQAEPPSSSPARASQSQPPAEYSVTESDTDSPSPLAPTHKRKRPPANAAAAPFKKARPAVLSPLSAPVELPPRRTPPAELPPHRAPPVEFDHSVTESDSDSCVRTQRLRAARRVREAELAKLRAANGGDPESATESESESELPPQARLYARPKFPRGADQPSQGLLMLDYKLKLAVPGSINTYLREYQRDGIRFFYRQYKAGLGALLGDDMGLGKTIQVISFLSAIMQKHGDVRDVDRRRNHVNGMKWGNGVKPPRADERWPTCLIVAPSTVVHNWAREFETWGYFEVGIYTGPPDVRKPVLTDFKHGRLDVVLTSPDTLRNDIEHLSDLPWTVCIVDEVHNTKNPASATARALRQVRCRCRIGLTGTAIQNGYGELHSILDWTNPGRVGTKEEWVQTVAGPLTKGQSKDATDDQRATAHLVAVSLRDKLLPKFFLRREKKIIKHQLPNKTDEVVFCPLTPPQVKVYKRILAMPEVDNMIKRDELCDCGSKKKRKKCCYPWVSGDLFKFMSTLIKISNHLALILPSPTDSGEQLERHRQLSRAAFGGEHKVPKYGPAMLRPDLCGKWIVLKTLMTEWSKDKTNKILIFTKSVKLLDMLAFHLDEQGYGFVKLDGSTKQADRMPLIDKFHEDPDITVFLISTAAGGTGLNLTGANKVVIFDPNWNPAHDLQAMDRAYRFGQTRDVHVYRLLGAGSLEELVYARQVYKQQQMRIGYEASVQTRYFGGVQNDAARQGELFGIKNIFKLHEEQLATKMAIEQAHVAELNWALENIASKKKKGEAGWVYEAEAAKSGIDGELAGLGALLFDDAAVPDVKSEGDVINGILKEHGVKYSHINEHILTANPIEEERSKAAVKAKQEKILKAKIAKDVKVNKAAVTKAAEASAPWPPPRRKRKDQLAGRILALVETGTIQHPDDYANFAHAFARKSREEQEKILALLDEHANRAKRAE